VELSECTLECLRKDEEFILYRNSHRNQAETSVLLLMPVLTRPALESLKKIDNEYSLRRELDATWAVRPLAVSKYNGRKALVLEDQGGEPLNRFIQGPMETTPFLRFAIGLANALGQLHERGLIHKDLKPSNVLIDSVTGHVWLTGFGIASRLMRERQSPSLPSSSPGHSPTWHLNKPGE